MKEQLEKLLNILLIKANDADAMDSLSADEIEELHQKVYDLGFKFNEILNLKQFVENYQSYEGKYLKYKISDTRYTYLYVTGQETNKKSTTLSGPGFSQEKSTITNSWFVFNTDICIVVYADSYVDGTLEEITKEEFLTKYYQITEFMTQKIEKMID